MVQKSRCIRSHCSPAYYMDGSAWERHKHWWNIRRWALSAFDPYSTSHPTTTSANKLVFWWSAIARNDECIWRN
jgi:hypothetical protein